MPVFNWPAPVGLNMAQTGIAVPEGDCIRLINFLPRQGYLEARKGTVGTLGGAAQPLGRITGSGNGFPVTVIAEHRNGSVVVGTDGSSASVNHTLYIVPAALTWTGNLAAAYTTSTAGTYYHHAYFDDRIVFTRAGLVPVDYDGTSITAMTVSGVTATDLDTALPFKGRMYYTTGNNKTVSGNFWYAAAGAYQGALTAFPAGDSFLRGGSVVLLVPLSIDGGNGPDDMLCVISDRGECLVYSGDDPGSATDWSLVGRFEVGRPLGGQCWAKVGSTTILATEHGPVDLQAVLSAGAGSRSAAISAKIARGVVTKWDNRQVDYDALMVHDASERAVYWFSRRKGKFDIRGSFPLISVMDTDTREWAQINGWGQGEFNLGVGGAANPNGGSQGDGGSSAAIVNGTLLLGNTLGRLYRASRVRSTDGADAKDTISADPTDVAHEILSGYSDFAQAGSFKQPSNVRVLIGGLDKDSADDVLLSGFVYFHPDWSDIQRRPFTSPWASSDVLLIGYPSRLSWFIAKGGMGRRLALHARVYNAGGSRWYGCDVDFSVAAETSGKR
jgi:hypothetical protein